MIRKVIIVVLTLAAVAICAASGDRRAFLTALKRDNPTLQVTECVLV
jgi:hypothetical protein